MSKAHKFLFVGDVVVNSIPQFSAEVAQLFDSAAICCCNVEAPLKGYGKPIDKTGPLVDQREDTADLLKKLGFNLFAMANNHICDFGYLGLEATIKAFPEGSVIGVGNEQEAYGLHIVEQDGVKYGFLAYAENGYGALNGDREIGYAWINHQRVNQDIIKYKEQVDYLVVQIHAGVEMLDVPIPEWRERYKELLDLGADVIIGHHPHVLQGIEEYNNKLICYSLGNFYFDYADSNHPQWNTGGILELSFKGKGKPDFRLHIVEKNRMTVSLWNEDKTASLIKELDCQLHGSDYEEYVNKKAIVLWQQAHKKYYAKPVNGLIDYSLIGVLKYIKALLFRRKLGYNMLWHNLFIESNLWIVKRAIRQLK